MKRNDKNMRRRTVVLLCRRGGLLVWEGAIDSSLCVASRRCYNTGLVEGEVSTNIVQKGERSFKVLRL
jgi:hypothetical protein